MRKNGNSSFTPRNTLVRKQNTSQACEKKVYVLGHRNPDTDSVVSAAAYSALKQAQGMSNVVPARAGKTTPQTEYIFNRFKVPVPEFIPDLIPKVRYYYNPDIKTVTTNVSLWEAMSLLKTDDSRALPVVDENGCYHSLLHYSFFAQKLVKISNPQQKTTIETSIELLASVLHAQAMVVRNAEEVRKSPIVVAASEFDTFKNILGTHIPENTIVVTGNRADVEEHAIDTGVRALIITNGTMLDKRLRERAEKNGVSILISPYDTSSTTLLLIYSMPARVMSNADLKPVNVADPIRKIVPFLSDAPGKALPVVGDDGVVVGVISESDIYQEPNIEVIMVDHNEQSQAIEGIENYKVLEIIDHHRLGNLTTRYPITFINKPVGATSTIIAQLYQENRVPLSYQMAAILLCGILSDTLVLQSATTTADDHEMAEYLANVANLDIEALGKDLLTAASNISGRTADELIRQDMKVYDDAGSTYTVSQIEVEDSGEVLKRKDEFTAVLSSERDRHNHLFCAVLVTDIIALTSIMIMAADEKFEHTITLPKQEDFVYDMRNVVSRKKQLMPILTEMVEKFHEQ